MFACPQCRSQLALRKESGLAFWDCGQCQGRAAGFAVIRQVLPPDVANELWQRAKTSQEIDSASSCPSCLSAMNRVNFYKNRPAPSLLLCVNCQYAWLPPEMVKLLASFLPSSAPSPSAAVPASAQEMLLRMQLAQQRERVEQAYGTDIPAPHGWKMIAALLGMPVESDASKAHNGWFVWPLAISTIALNFIIVFPNLVEIVTNWGFLPALPWRHGGLTFLSSFFIHAGIMHLIGNMYFLMVFGKKTEDFLGPLRNLVLLFGAALAGSLAHMMWDPHPLIPCVGASGGISGVLVFAALQFPGDRLTFFWGFRWRRISSLAFLGIWIFLQAKSAMFQAYGLSAVSAFAHLGGAATGLALWMVWRKKAHAEFAPVVQIS